MLIKKKKKKRNASQYDIALINRYDFKTLLRIIAMGFFDNDQFTINIMKTKQFKTNDRIITKHDETMIIN